MLTREEMLNPTVCLDYVLRAEGDVERYMPERKVRSTQEFTKYTVAATLLVLVGIAVLYFFTKA
ncbi:MAG: hypothetical protein V3T58_07740 [Candidatus Hydrothermarchaeales archaeon]